MRTPRSIFRIFVFLKFFACLLVCNINASDISEKDILIKLKALQPPIYLTNIERFRDGGTLIIYLVDNNKTEFVFSLPAYHHGPSGYTTVGFNIIYADGVKLTKNGEAEKMIVDIVQECIDQGNITTNDPKFKSIDYLMRYAKKFVSYLATRREPIENEEWVTRVNNEYGYQIDHLNTWELSEYGDAPKPTKYFDSFYYHKRSDGGIVGHLHCSVSIVVYNSNGLDLISWLKKYQADHINSDIENNHRLISYFKNRAFPFKIAGQEAVLTKHGDRTREGIEEGTIDDNR